MKRPAIAAVFAVVALLGATGADGKAPPSGVDICGADGACVHLAMQQVEQEWALFSAIDNGIAPPPVSRFYGVSWQWAPDMPTIHGYYVPASGTTWQLDPHRMAVWQQLANPRPIRLLASTVTPFAAPLFTRVTVGGRAVRDPRSYAKLFGRGVDAFPIILPGWIPITFTASSPNPWSDQGTDIRISRRGALLWENGSIVKIPLRLAQRIRAGKALR